MSRAVVDAVSVKVCVPRRADPKKSRLSNKYKLCPTKMRGDVQGARGDGGVGVAQLVSALKSLASP